MLNIPTGRGENCGEGARNPPFLDSPAGTNYYVLRRSCQHRSRRPERTVCLKPPSQNYLTTAWLAPRGVAERPKLPKSARRDGDRDGTHVACRIGKRLLSGHPVLKTRTGRYDLLALACPQGLPIPPVLSDLDSPCPLDRVTDQPTRQPHPQNACPPTEAS